MKIQLTKVLNIPALFTLRQIKKRNIPEIDRISSVLSDTIMHRLDDSEKEYVNRIESRRRKLQTDSQLLRIIDYGAGEANSLRSEEQMAAGIEVNKTVSEISRSAKNYFWSVFLFKLLREIKPLVCLELGTNLGISAAYQAAALKLNKRGRMISIEGAESLADSARLLLNELSLDNISVVTGRFQDTLQHVLRENKPVDFVFVDGHHSERATIEYFQNIIPFLSPKALLVFDDISWSAGMVRAWNTIRRDERIRLAVKLNSIGLCVLGDRQTEKHYLQIPVVLN